jgi:hypothetical protein
MPLEDITHWPLYFFLLFLAKHSLGSNVFNTGTHTMTTNTSYLAQCLKYLFHPYCREVHFMDDIHTQYLGNIILCKVKSPINHKVVVITWKIAGFLILILNIRHILKWISKIFPMFLNLAGGVSCFPRPTFNTYLAQSADVLFYKPSQTGGASWQESCWGLIG